MRNKLMCICFILWIVLSMSMPVYALGFDAGRTGSVTITLTEHSSKMPIRGAEFSLYHVASVTLDESGDLSYIYSDAFADFDVRPDDPSAAAELDAYVREHSAAAQKNVTDSQGRTVFSNLPLGLYFVKQTNYVDGYAVCRSFLVSVPGETNGRYTYDIKAVPKTELAKFTDITIRKVWNVDEFTEIADSVEVELLRDGAAVKTAVLNEMNSWEVTYYDMPESDSYSIVELDIPEGFIAAYTSRGYEFTVTNSLYSGLGDGGDEDPGAGDADGEDSDQGGSGSSSGGSGGSGYEDSSSESGREDAALIQTGQIVWPIPILAMAGMFLISVGTVILRRTRDNNE